ncbi:hypothetical protein EVJ33_06360 [Exiguobacterium sp. SL-10]|uniref:hypothetical protein n=1 Tax=Exiguobacterium sp. SL-10 TaxID=2510962 RepID=UPI00103B3286|nr:hypothetical protein [Exiguobacterium sp. SL-10]TCI30282.1 hypothetical protein EVJ33_06360 [Exiguobacterium sp. SL-10]
MSLVLSAPTLSAGNLGAASLTLLGLRRIAVLQESGRRGTSESNSIQHPFNDASAGARTPRGAMQG